MAYLSPIVARKRIRIEQKISNRKRAREQQPTRKSSSHQQKSTHRIYVPPAKGEFIHIHVEYYLNRCDEYNPLLSTLTRDQLINYTNFLKSRYIQNFYGPLVQLLMQHKDNHGTFNVPVDPERQNLPTYYDIVTQPMDLGTIRDKLACGKYTHSRDLINDIRLVFQNAKKFNPPNHFISMCATSLLKLLDTELEKIRNRMEQNRINQNNHCCPSCRGYPCRLCGEKCLKYSPPVYVCDGDCHERILRNATYYIIRGKKGRYCQKCYAKKVAGMDKAERKNLFVRKKNDDIFPESWIQCSRCHEWMHCVCGLVHPRQASASYVCPLCLADDIYRVPKPVLGSKAIPTCPLSDFLTQRIYACVDEEVKKLPKRYQLNESELKELKEGLIVRCVSNISTTVSVKKGLIPLYTSTGVNELIIPYQSKCIAFFQHRNGVDILLFVLYVHEFNDNVPKANQRCIYISYLDSVHFLSPRYLRTPIYHTLLTAYLEYAKERGYCRAHIWSCPPSRGDDYIFSHHPRDQRTPNADHLIDWYRSLLAKGVKEGIISHISCQLDELLHMNAIRSHNLDIYERQIQCLSVHGSKDNELPESVLERVQSTTSPLPISSPQSSDYESDTSKENDNDLEETSSLSSLSTTTTSTIQCDISSQSGTAVLNPSLFTETEKILYLNIPYFEGDYLPYVGEDLLKDIYQESIKPKTPRSTLSHKTSLASNAKNKAELRERILQDNILQLPSEFLRKYAKSMLENPSRFMTAYLRPYCNNCGEIIVGDGLRCDDCYDHNTPFFLCSSCAMKSIPHPHPLHPIHCDDLPCIQEKDPLISYPFLDKRHEFLRLCQGNFLQFDTLRQSILSTSVVMEFIFHKVPDPFLDMCDSCEKVLDEEYYACQYHDDYRLCKDCLNKDGGIHSRTHQMPKVNNV